MDQLKLKKQRRWTSDEGNHIWTNETKLNKEADHIGIPNLKGTQNLSFKASSTKIKWIQQMSERSGTNQNTKL